VVFKYLSGNTNGWGNMLEILISGLVFFLEALLSFLLIREWRKTEKHFIGDLPFMFGTAITAVSISSLIKFLISLEIISVDLWVFQLRGIFIDITGCILLLVTLKLWLPSYYKFRIITALGYGVCFAALMFLVASNVTEIMFYTTPLIVFTILLAILTFATIYRTKRLPNINSLYVTIGLLSVFLGQLIKIILPPFEIFTLINILDIVGWCLIVAGVLSKAK